MTSLPKEVTTSEQLADFLKKLHIQVLDNVASPEMVKAANAHGVAVWLDVQDPKEGPASWNEALRKGVQGLQTDKPAEMVGFFKNHSSQ
jgi:glycerophosphoryl diester phosphodiesterase